MKKLYVFLVLVFILASCSVRKKPIFLSLDNFRIVSLELDTLNLKADALFKNENSIGGTISTDKIKVYVNGAEVAQVFSEEFKVPAKKEFTVPLNVKLPTSDILNQSKGGVLLGLLNTVLNNSLKIQFKGDIKYKILGISSVYPIDKTKEIKLKN